jgi:hypothetical protein
MPALQNSIGNSPDEFYFEDLQGAIVLRAQKLQLLERLGIDGTGVRKTGVRGVPFQLRSVHYVADWDATEEALLAYQSLIGAEPVDVWQHDVLFGTFLVLNVEQLPETRACYNVTPGTIVENPECLQYCLWTLLG